MIRLMTFKKGSMQRLVSFFRAGAELSGRQPRQAALLGVYSGVSFYLLFFFTYYFESSIYENLVRSAPFLSAGRLESYEVKHWYIHKQGVIFPEVMTPYRMWYETLPTAYLLGWALSLGVAAVLIGWMVYRFSFVRSWRLLAPAALYVSIPFLVARLYPDMFGIQITCWIYLFLLFVMRGAQLFNPHLEIQASDRMVEKKFEAILRMYHQYFLISLAVMALVSTTFLFGVQSSFRELFKKAEPIFPAMEWPYYLAYISYSILGIIGLAFGVTREFHLKLHETLRMKL